MKSTISQMVFKSEIVVEIRKDQVLFGKVATALGVAIRTLQDKLPANKPELATASSLKVIREHLSQKWGRVVQDKELLMELVHAA